MLIVDVASRCNQYRDEVRVEEVKREWAPQEIQHVSIP